MYKNIISGKAISEQILNELKDEVEELKKQNHTPHITIVQVGNNQASNVYVRNKLKLCERIGVVGNLCHFEENISERELLDKINEFNTDRTIHGILVQLPLPKEISEDKIIEAINPKKDVDCFHNENVGKV